MIKHENEEEGRVYREATHVAYDRETVWGGAEGCEDREVSFITPASPPRAPAQMKEEAAQSVVHLGLLRKCMENYKLARSKQEVWLRLE